MINKGHGKLHNAIFELFYFTAVVNGIVSLISFLDCSVLVYRTYFEGRSEITDRLNVEYGRKKWVKRS